MHSQKSVFQMQKFLSMADAASFVKAAKNGDVKVNIHFKIRSVSIGILNGGTNLTFCGMEVFLCCHNDDRKSYQQLDETNWIV